MNYEDLQVRKQPSGYTPTKISGGQDQPPEFKEASLKMSFSLDKKNIQAELFTIDFSPIESKMEYGQICRQTLSRSFQE